MINESENSAAYSQSKRRVLRLFSRGGRQFAISENEIVAVAEWSEPAPLPHAPSSVLGVVGVHGRMLTVLDIARFAGLDSVSPAEHLPKGQRIIALRGDEQLALVVDEIGETIEVATELAADHPEKLISAAFTHEQGEINILNLAQLFPHAIQGRERRRRRF